MVGNTPLAVGDVIATSENLDNKLYIESELSPTGKANFELKGIFERKPTAN